jgi:hypothetical protein
MELEPSEIAAKCSSLDSTNKLYTSKGDRKGEPPSGPLPKPPNISALSKSLDDEAQRNLPFPRAEFMSGPPAWSRAGNGVASSYADAPFSPNGSSRHGRTNGSFASNGTEPVFYTDEDRSKPREFATEAPFVARSRDSETSTSMEDKKHTQDVTDTPEAIAQLERYIYYIIELTTVIFICYKPKLNSRGC